MLASPQQHHGPVQPAPTADLWPLILLHLQAALATSELHALVAPDSPSTPQAIPRGWGWKWQLDKGVGPQSPQQLLQLEW